MTERRKIVRRIFQKLFIPKWQGNRKLSIRRSRSDSPQRISDPPGWTDGYGEFCFSSNYMCLICYNPFSDNPSVLSESPPSDINTVSRHSFPFLNLPKEIRDKIYSMWLLPLRNEYKDGIIKIQLEPSDEKSRTVKIIGLFRNGYQALMPMAISRIEDGPRNTEHRHISTHDYVLLCTLSHICHQFREEIGSLFWEKVHLDIDHWYGLTARFLDDRPAIHSGIRKISMDWDCDDDDENLTGVMVGFSNYLKEHLELDEIVWSMAISEGVVRDIIVRGDEIEWVKAFREVKVKKLTVVLVLVSLEDTDPLEFLERGSSREDNEESGEITGEGRRAKEESLGAALTLTLRPPVRDITAQERYLLSRT